MFENLLDFFSIGNPIIGFINKVISYGSSVADFIGSWYNSSIGYILLPSGRFPLLYFQPLIEVMFSTTLFFIAFFAVLFIYRLIRGNF